MARNGSGTYVLPAGNPVITGGVISSTWANNTLNDIASALTGSIATDGQTSPTANLTMAGFNHTNVGVATLRSQYATAGQVQDSSATLLSGISGTNTIVATAPLTMSAYATGQIFTFIPAANNTGAVTININGIGAKAITKGGTTALASGDLATSVPYQIFYDGTRFQLLTGALSASLSASSGSSLVGYTQGGAGSVATTVQSKLREAISVKDFGAVGDGTTDDYAAIQAALNYVGSTGGGTVIMPKTNGQYRITQGLKLPAYTTLQGVAPDRYPFNSGATNSSCLFADFSVANQWVIDTSATKVSTGLPFAYNELCNNVAPNFVYNSCVRDLFIRAGSTMPWGGIRIQGCPGAVVDNVSVIGCGTGMLVNYTFGGNFSFHCLTPYYGVVAWDNVNANNWELYCSATTPVAQTVPVGYLQPMMNALNGSMVSVLKLNTNAHYNRSWGVILGDSGTSTSSNNSLDITVERYSGGIFQYYSYGTVFNKFYFEGTGTTEMNYACVSAYSRWVSNSLHAYLVSSSCYYVDLGIANQIRLTPIGLKLGSYGFGPFLDNSSLVTIDGIEPSLFGPAVPQFNMYYTAGKLRTAVSAFQNSWASVGGLYDTVNYELKMQIHEVNLTGAITGGSPGTVAFTLPLGYRPLYRVQLSIYGGTVQIDPDGKFYVLTGTTVALEGVRFTASP